MKTKIKVPDIKVLERMQKIYTETLSVYTCCYGRPFVELVGVDASEEEAPLIGSAVDREELKLLVASFSDRPIENIIEAVTAVPYVKCRGIAIRDRQGACIAVWVFIAFCSELMDDQQKKLAEGMRLTTESALESVMPLIERLGNMYFMLYDSEGDVSAATDELGELSLLLSREKEKNEALAGIMDLLESEQDFSKCMDDILGICGEYTKVTHAFLLRRHKGTGLIDMINEWQDGTKKPMKDSFVDLKQEQLPFFDGRPYTISTESTLPEDFGVFFKANDIRAGVFLPLEINSRTSMYVCFIMKDEPRKWMVDELHFFNAIKRVIQSILSRRIAQNSLAGSYAALDAILDNSGCGTCVMLPGQKEFLYRNSLFNSMLSEEKDEQDFVRTLFTTPDEVHEIAEYYASTARRWFHISLSQIRWVDGQVVRLSTLYEITKEKERLQQMEKAAYTDYLTGLYNRQRFESDFALLIKDAKRADESGSFFYLNLDDFKAINGGPGMQIGDAVLKETAKALLGVCRSKASCYRLGGDEFGVLVPYTGADYSERLVETIRHRFEQPWEIDGQEYNCTMSMGVVSFPTDGDRVYDLMQRAHLALDIAKEGGRGQAKYYDKDTAESTSRRNEIEARLKEAVAEGCRQFEVFYRPMKDGADPKHSIVGAEAYLRWNSPDLGYLEADEFYPVAEYLNLAGTIGWHILHTALATCKHWNDFGNPEFNITVGVSVVQLSEDDFARTVETELKESGLDPQNLTLEITESVAMGDMDKIKTTLAAIKRLGVGIALDDFSETLVETVTALSDEKDRDAMRQGYIMEAPVKKSTFEALYL